MADAARPLFPARFRDCRAPAFLALSITSVYALIALQSSLWDRDEPRYARATVEMIESGDYLVPTFNGVLRPHKPPLIYWLMSVPVRLLGDAALAFRLPSVLATAATAVLVFLIGGRFFDHRTAVWAALIFAANPMTLVIGTAATTDAVLVACMTAAIAAFVCGPDTVGYRSRTLLMALAVGGAWLAKGPVALLPTLTMWLAIGLGPPHNCTKRRDLSVVTLSLLLGIATFLAWAIPANSATEGEFYRQGVGFHVFSRMLRPLEGHGGAFLLYLPYYVIVVLAGLFPWTLFLPAGISLCLKRDPANVFRPLLLAWILPTVVIMTAVATKLPHYIYFIWPALALCAARAVVTLSQQPRGEDRQWGIGLGRWIFALSATAVVVAAVVCPMFLSIPGLVLPAAVIAGLWLAGTVVALICLRQQRYVPAAAALASTLGVTLLPILFGIIPAVEQVKIAPRVGQIVRERASPDTPVAVCGYAEPSLNFYIGRPIEAIRSQRELEEWAGASGSGLLLITTDHLDRLAEHPHLSPASSVRGIDYVSGRRLDIRLYLRTNDATVSP